MVLPYSDRIPRVPPYSYTHNTPTSTGLSPSLASLPKLFELCVTCHWPSPLSLTTTNGVSFDVLSSGYLDVSVPRVRLINLCIQLMIPSLVGFPIRISADQCSLPAPRSFSQAITSFIASQCQGIHQAPFLALDTLQQSDVNFLFIVYALFLSNSA